MIAVVIQEMDECACYAAPVARSPMPSPKRLSTEQAASAISDESVRTIMRDRSCFKTSQKKAASCEHSLSGVGWGVPGLCTAALPAAAPAAAPTSPSNAVAPKPIAHTSPMPGTTIRVAATNPRELPRLPPKTLPMIFASLCERLRKTTDSRGTPRCNNSVTAPAAPSWESNAPIAVCK
jgi:hypothetical protein